MSKRQQKWQIRTIINDQITLYCHFNKIIKGTISSPFPVQNHFHFQYLSYFPLRGNAYVDVTDFENCVFHKNIKILISQERNIIFPSNKKKSLVKREELLYGTNSFVAEVTFNQSLPVFN